jgi:hypothetical protein
MLTIVTGPPGAGKSAYVNVHRRVGDLVWDFDVLAEAMARCPSHPRPTHVASCLYALRGALLRFIDAYPTVNAFVIIANVEEAARVATEHHGEIVYL